VTKRATTSYPLCFFLFIVAEYIKGLGDFYVNSSSNKNMLLLVFILLYVLQGIWKSGYFSVRRGCKNIMGTKTDISL